MITEWVIQVWLTVVTWLLGLLPAITLPSWVTTVTSFVSSTVTQARALGNWIPWGMVGLGFVFVAAAYAVALGIRVGRIVASFFTAGGGSAA